MKNLELKLNNEDVIVTKSDIRGKISFVNSDVIRISGYSRKELLGSNHNIFRHDDMPAAVFENLWQTIQKEYTWEGIIKNRTKCGNFYWVKAVISPIYEKEKLIGYISVRTKPNNEEKIEAKIAYQQMKNGSFEDELYYGKIEKKGIFKYINTKIENIKINKKFLILEILITIIFVLSTIENLNEIRNEMNENKFMIEKLVDVLDKKNTNNINDYQIEKNKEIIKKNFRNIKENKTIYAYIINIFMNFFLFIIFFLSLNYFRKSLIVPINEVTENLKNLSSGNFILKFNYRSKNELGEINEAIRAMASHLGFDIAYKNLTDIEINNSKNKIKLVEQKLEFTKQINHLQRIDTIGRMTAGISHNFNNILSSIIGYNDLNIFMIEKSSDKILKDEIMDNSNQICIASNKGASLIRSMMVFSNQNLTNRKMKIKKTSIVINDILVLIKPILNKCIKINTKINTDLVIEIDEIELHQILMNLIINSRDSIKNEGSIDIKLEKVLINGKCISCLQHIKGDFLVLTVQDNGSGISDDLMDKIFEPFFTTKEVGKGTGLGLASVSGLVHESNGHIIINSQTGIKNSGTKFKLIFPI